MLRLSEEIKEIKEGGGGEVAALNFPLHSSLVYLQINTQRRIIETGSDVLGEDYKGWWLSGCLVVVAQ